MKRSTRFLSLLLVFVLVFCTVLLSSCKKEIPLEEETSDESNADASNENSLNYIIKTEIKEGAIWVTYSNDPDNPVNIGAISVSGEGADGSPSYLLLPNGTYGVTAGNAKYLDKIVIAETYNGKPVSTILPDAFNGAYNLTSISIPNSITTVGDNAFANCDKLALTEVDDVCYLGNESNPYVVLVGTSDPTISQCMVKETTKAICSNAFYECTNLKTITIPNSVTSIGEKAFYNCKLITEINIPAGNTYIGPETFYGCASLKKITIPASVSTLGVSAFQDCKSLETVTFEKDSLLWGIPNKVFSGCEKLKSINIPKNVAFIGDNKAVSNLDGTFSGCKALTNITFEEGSVLTQIGNHAFDACGKLTSITLPATLKEIGVQAFRIAGLTEIVIPEGVTRIHAQTFTYCGSLKKVTFGSKLNTIESKAFQGCVALNNVILPESLKLIELGAFSGCSALKSVVFKKTDGWYSVHKNNGEYKAIAKATLSNVATAASTLTDLTLDNTLIN